MKLIRHWVKIRWKEVWGQREVYLRKHYRIVNSPET